MDRSAGRRRGADRENLLDAAAATEAGEAAAAPSDDLVYRAIAQLYLDQDAAEDETVRTSDGERALHGGDDSLQTLYDERDLRPDPNAARFRAVNVASGAC